MRRVALAAVGIVGLVLMACSPTGQPGQSATPQPGQASDTTALPAVTGIRPQDGVWLLTLTGEAHPSDFNQSENDLQVKLAFKPDGSITWLSEKPLPSALPTGGLFDMYAKGPAFRWGNDQADFFDDRANRFVLTITSPTDMSGTGVLGWGRGAGPYKATWQAGL